MMRFLADMGVSIRAVEWLRDNGHDAKHLREEGLHRMPNGEIFTKAIHENRILITFDLDFGEIVALSKGKKRALSYSVCIIPEHPLSSADYLLY
jgi:predicted nuclease of predicted toxin-antitoxin system